jgi:hypothetical protein
LFANNTAVTNFWGTFYDCSKLEANINDIITAEFDKVTDVRQMFYNCAKVTGNATEVMAKFTGLPTEGNTNTAGAFSGCVGLDDYAYIPTTWGGLGQERPEQ